MCLSASMFLHLCFCCDQLEVARQPLHRAFVRYFGIGSTAICLHDDSVAPHVVQLPSMVMMYSPGAQLKWLRQESAELRQVRLG